MLIINVEPSICADCRIVLSERGYLADTRNSGNAGLEALLSGRCGLALIDMRLPDMDGMEILRMEIQAKLLRAGALHFLRERSMARCPFSLPPV